MPMPSSIHNSEYSARKGLYKDTSFASKDFLLCCGLCLWPTESETDAAWPVLSVEALPLHLHYNLILICALCQYVCMATSDNCDEWKPNQKNIPKHFWTSLYIRAFSGGFLPRKRGWMIYNARGRVGNLPLKCPKVISNMRLYCYYCVLESLSTPHL